MVFAPTLAGFLFCQNVRDAMSALQNRDVQSALRSLRDLMPGDELNQLQPSGPAAVYTTLTMSAVTSSGAGTPSAEGSCDPIGACPSCG